MKVTTFFISRIKQNYTKYLTASESALKINIILGWILYEILLMSAVICKQRLLYKNEIVQYDWNYKLYDFIQNHFRNPLLSVVKTFTIKKNIYTCTSRTPFRDRSIFSYSKCLNWYSFGLFWQNYLNYIFYKLHQRLPKQAKNHIPRNTQ